MTTLRPVARGRSHCFWRIPIAPPFCTVAFAGMSSIPIEKAVEIALEQHQAGNFARAEALYMEILRQDPGNVDAIHLPGVLAHQGHQPQIAVDLISAAIRKRD